MHLLLCFVGANDALRLIFNCEKSRAGAVTRCWSPSFVVKNLQMSANASGFAHKASNENEAQGS